MVFKHLHHEGKHLGLAHACTHSPAVLSIQQTESWDVPNLELPGHVCCGSISGFAALLVSEQFCTIKRSWKFEERCTASLFGTTQAQVWRCAGAASRVSLKYFEKDVGEEPKTPTFSGDLKVELGMMCTDGNDVEDLTAMYGPLCWQGCFKKLMLHGIMKE